MQSQKTGDDQDIKQQAKSSGENENEWVEKNVGFTR
jgi:hypothetical protein